jgi:hypothetical protein
MLIRGSAVPCMISTGQEIEVLRLVSAARSNRDIRG